MLKHRYVFIFVILSVLCLSIGVAFAAEDASNNLADASSLDANQLQASDDGVLMDEDNEDEPGRWADLNKLISENESDEFTLEKDYQYDLYDDPDNEHDPQGILIEKNITIDGDGHTLDGRGYARAFNITRGTHVTLKNIIFESCYGDEGGAIYNSGTLTIENCVFNGNGRNYEEDCISSNGGAIYNGGDLDVTDSVFYQNEAVNGGAIYSAGGLNVTRSAFLENRAEDNGRDVFIASGTANISNSYMSTYDWDDKYVVYVEDGVEEGSVVLDDNYWSGDVFEWEYDEESGEDVGRLLVSNVGFDTYLELRLEVGSEDDSLNIGEEYQFMAYFVRNGTDVVIKENLPESNIIFYVENIDGHTEEIEEVPLENGQTSHAIEEGQYAMHCAISVGDSWRLNGDAEFPFGQTYKNWDDLKEDIANNPEVVLDVTYRYDGGCENHIIELNTNNQVIDGNFKTLNGVNEASAFKITANNIVIKNLNFNKCRGAIILDGGSVTLINCTFENCEGKWDDEEECDLVGSALRINPGTANLIDCIIKNCRQCAVYNGGTLNVSNSIFMNSAEGYDGANVYISENAQNTIINNSCLFVIENWDNRFNVYFVNPEEAEYDLNNNFWGVENPGEDNACVNAEVKKFIYAKIETPVPDFMNHETTFTLKFYNSDKVQLTDFFNGEVQFIESYNYNNYNDGYSNIGDPVEITDGTATCNYTLTNEDIQFIGALIIYDGEAVGVAKCNVPAYDFTALIELIDIIPENGVLNLTRDYNYGGRDSRDGEIDCILIDKNITINGNGFAIYSGEADGYQSYQVDCRGFVITEGCIVVINDLNIEISNPVSDKGSAFYNQGNLTLNNCNVTGEMIVIDEGEVPVIYGGVIYNGEGAVMTINSSKIEGGASGMDYYPDDLTAYGGVIYNKGSMTITESQIEGREYGDEDHENCPTYGGGIYNEGDLNVTYSILCHSSAKKGTDIYHNGTSLYVSNSILASCEPDITRRHLFDFVAVYGKYNLYAKETKNCELNNIWWGTNTPDENTTNIVLDNHVIFSLTAQNDIIEGEENIFIIEFKNNETGEKVLACPHGEIMYFFIEKYNGKSVYVGNETLSDDGRCSISYTPESSDYLISAGFDAHFNMYGQFDISDVRMELPLGLGGFTFTDLHDQIADADGILELTADYRYESDKDGLYAEGVLIENKNVIIEGNGHTINCVGLSTPFNITGSNVTIRNVHLVNCKEEHPIHAYGSTNLTLINCDNYGVVNDGGYEISIGSGAHVDICCCNVEYIANYGSVNINSSRISHLDGFNGSSTIVHNSIFRAYGDTTFVAMEEDAFYDLNDNFWDEDDPKTRIEGADFDSYLEIQFLTSYAPKVDVLNYFTVRFVYNGTDMVNTNVNIPISFQKEFVDEIDGHPHTELIANMNISEGVARLQYCPDINTARVIFVWGEIEDTGAFFFDEFYKFEIIPIPTRINVDQDNDTIYINVTSSDDNGNTVLVETGSLEVTVYYIPEEDNGQSQNGLLGMSVSYMLADDENRGSLSYFITRDISELENHILNLSKAEIAEALGIDSFGGGKWVIIISFHSSTENFADSEYYADFDNETKFYTIITTVDNHIGNKAFINVKVQSNRNFLNSGTVKLYRDDEFIDEKELTSSGAIFTLENMEPGSYDRNNGNYAIVFVDEDGKEASQTINFIVCAPTTITTIISNDIGSVEITINMGNITLGTIDLYKNGESVKHLELNGTNSVLIALNDLIAGALNDDSYTINFVPLNWSMATAKNTTFDLSRSQEGFGGIIIISDLPSDATGSFVLGLDDGTNMTVDPSEGIPVLELSPGGHKLKLSYDGNDYETFDLDLDYTVKESAASDISLSTVVGSHILKVSGVPSDLSEKILVTIDGTTYEGTASGIEIPSFSSPGIVAAIISYPGDAKYSSFTKNVNIAVSKIATKINPNSVTFYASPNSGYLTFYILDSSGKGLAKTVNVIFNGKTYAVNTNANGYGSIKLSAAAAKTYTASLKFAGDSIYAGSSASVQVKVNKNKVKITAKTKKVKKSAKKLKIKYLFKTSTGKKLALKGLTVYLKINKKTVKAKTSSKGIATFKVKLPKKKKTYKVKVIFKGNKANIKKTLSTKLKVY